MDKPSSAKPKLAIKTLFSPVSGESEGLESHPNILIAKGLQGKGVHISPLSSRIVAPCKAKVINISAIGHQITLACGHDLIVEIVIGHEPLKHHGLGFNRCVKVGDIVNAGQVLVELDLIALNKLLEEVVVAMLVSKGAVKLTPYLGNMRAGEDEVMQLIIKAQE